MKATQLGQLLCSSLFVVALFNSAIAQETFTISGPIESFSFYSTDGIPEVIASSFSATVRFDPGAPVSITDAQDGMYAESYFEPAIIDIEFTVRDESGSEIARIINSSASGQNVSNYVNVFDDLSETFEDQILYHLFVQSTIDDADALASSATSSSMNVLNLMAILFGDTSGGMVNDTTQLPSPPALGDFDRSIISVVFMESGEEFFSSLTATGEITDIVFEASGPYEQCAEDAWNHGQYVRCVSQINNALRATGEISGKDKGQRQKEAARSKK